MSDDTINFEVDGKPFKAKKGQMIMEVTDNVGGAYIPRFCYHPKLSVAANCRMCLVEVEKAPKPLPACATPVAEGMKVFTRSPRAIEAQRAVMEFLLINHPLDCPICDQGGECELQDLAMGYGRDVSRFTDRKRVVKDQDLGPLISTDMTRCIHCTRCVRFGEEVQGYQQLGTMGRGENMKISTYIEQSIDHELSGNIIDLCPVGALNNKPYRYSARAWEMVQRSSVSPHDCVGSNLYVHLLRGKIKRIVPRENELINETWLADRDRYSFYGMYSDDRLMTPRVKEDGAWREIDWQEALERLATQLKAAGGDIGILASPNATLEEQHLLAKLAAAMGSANIDHRLRQRDFSDQDNDPLFPWLGCDIAGIERERALLIVGSNLRREAPILAHRVRKAALQHAAISFVNRQRYEYLFTVADYLAGAGLVEQLSGIAAAAAAASGTKLPPAVSKLCEGVAAGEPQQRVARSLAEADGGLVLLGQLALRDPAFAAIRALAAAIASLTGARFGYVSEGANAAGAHLAGVLPHRAAGGAPRERAGRHAGSMLDDPLGAVLLFGIEPDRDLAGDATDKLAAQRLVAAMTPFVTPAFERCADLLLPIGTPFESSGTFVNGEGRWQSFGGVATLIGEARPAWKVLRVLGNLLDAEGFDYVSSEDVRDELKAALGDVSPDNACTGTKPLPHGDTENGDSPHFPCPLDVPMYRVDALVRRSLPLQLMRDPAREPGEEDAA
ncbi:MAG TPA: NADH-quinone oxidoreductase subunit NuoG [Woeseiaceae bacterium]|nr:NADH-quinone oxidoreductase subunit NuoG [Woeseiaceae bacterium]